jgi:hypothetical protein
MIALIIMIAAWMFKIRGGRLEFRRGVPFAWYHWADYKHASPFNLVGLIADILFWTPLVLGAGVLTERFLKRR